MRIFTLTLNPAFDVHASLSRLEKHAENLATVTDRDAGGKGVNISRALLAADKKSLALVAVGEGNGEEFCRALEADGIAFHTFFVAGRIRENLTFHEEGAPETRISFGGLSADRSLLLAVEEYLDAQVSEHDILTLTGRLPSGLEMSEVKAFLCRMKDKGVRLVIDSRSFSLDDILDVMPWLIKPNEEEACAYLGKEATSLADAKEGACRLQRAGIENVMLSLGKKGALLATSEGAWLAEAPVVKPISTVGAGDSSIAGFLAAVSEGKSIEEALCTAVAYGTAACLQAGTKPPIMADVARLLLAVQLKRI